jgi:AraC family transcriptional regulator
MIVTTQFPDLPPRPETAVNAAFRRRFFARWGQENSVFLASTKHAEYGPMPTALSFKTVLEGSATLMLERRRVVLEPGRFLLVNAGQSYGVSIRSERPVRCLSLHFHPQLARELAAGLGLDWAAALDGASRARQPLLRETLRTHEATLMPALQRISAAVQTAGSEPESVEADFIELLAALLRQEQRQRADTLTAMSAVRVSTREELARRVGWATDFIHSAYAEPIQLDDIAAAAHLSKFHLIRAFRELHRCTPHQFVQARRVEAAHQLLANRSLDLETVAAAAGFGSRWTLQRALRLHLGATGHALRAQRAKPADDAPAHPTRGCD